MSTTEPREYVPTLIVKARRVLTKTETVVTSSGLFTAQQNDYIVDTPHVNESGETYYVTHVLDNDAFNDTFKRRDANTVNLTPDEYESRLQTARDEGYASGWADCNEQHDTANNVVHEDDENPPDITEDGETVEKDGPTFIGDPPQHVESERTDQTDNMIPPVGDRLETDGPVKVRTLP